MIKDPEPTYVLDERTMEVMREALVATGAKRVAEYTIAYHDTPRWRWLERRRRREELIGMIGMLRHIYDWTPYGDDEG